MKRIINYIKNKFKPKIEQYITLSQDMEQGDCSNCNSKATLIYYQSFYEKEYESFYRCSKCLTKIDGKEYDHIIKLKLRKQKLQKLNDTKI